MLVCPDCFENRGLQQRIIEIRPAQPPNKCSLHPSKKGVSIAEVARIVDRVFRENYAGGIPDGSQDGSGSDLADVLYSLTGAVDDQVVNALIESLVDGDDYWPPDGDEPFYSDEYDYLPHRAGLEEHGRLWESFRRSLMHDQRFFNAEAKELLSKIFAGIHQQRDVDRQGPVYMIRPGEDQATFLRARIADSAEVQDKIRENLAAHLGPPPERLRKAGRLNPSGVAAFYAAFDFDTCVAELRPHVGSFVMAAEFRITEEICVLDTTRFDAKPKEPNPFAVGAIQRAAQWRFMKTFMGLIARPISPGDEHLDYVPTQAVAEYLVRHHRFKFGGQDRTIDAIIYRSAQRPSGKNIVILGAAAVSGPTPEERIREKAKQDAEAAAFLGWKFPETETPRVRIVPVPGSLRTDRVDGASFRTVPRPDPWKDLPDDDRA